MRIPSLTVLEFVCCPMGHEWQAFMLPNSYKACERTRCKAKNCEGTRKTFGLGRSGFAGVGVTRRHSRKWVRDLESESLDALAAGD